MQVTEHLNEGLKRGYKVVVAATTVDAKMEERLNELAGTVKMAGFRPGKVPMNVVRKKYGSSVMGEVLEIVINESSTQVIKDKDLRPALPPKIEITNFDAGKDLEFTMILELFPEVPHVEWNGIALEKWSVDVAEKEIQEGLERIQKFNKEFVPVETPRAAVTGDTLVIDFEGRVDNVAFAGGTATDFRIELGSGSLIPGFEDQLVGANVGDDVLVKVTFPENYGSQELAGKAAEFSVKVKEILAPKDADLNDEFATKLGFETLDKLKDAIREQIQKDYDQLSLSKLKKELFDILDTAQKFDIPPSMVQMEFDSLAQKVANQNDEEKENLQKMAERRVRLGILLAETGRRENVEITEEELRQAVFAMAVRYPGQEQTVIDYYRKNPKAVEELKGPILEDKVVDLVIKKANITNKTVSIDELSKFFNEENAG